MRQRWFPVHVLEAVDPSLLAGPVDKHEAVAILPGRDALAVSNIHPHNIEGRLRRSKEFAMAAAFEVHDVTDGQEGVGGVYALVYTSRDLCYKLDILRLYRTIDTMFWDCLYLYKEAMESSSVPYPMYGASPKTRMYIRYFGRVSYNRCDSLAFLYL